MRIGTVLFAAAALVTDGDVANADSAPCTHCIAWEVIAQDRAPGKGQNAESKRVPAAGLTITLPGLAWTCAVSPPRAVGTRETATLECRYGKARAATTTECESGGRVKVSQMFLNEEGVKAEWNIGLMCTPWP